MVKKCEKAKLCKQPTVDDPKAGKWTVAKLDGLLKVNGPGLKLIVRQILDGSS